jgi:hypothetical protein
MDRCMDQDDAGINLTESSLRGIATMRRAIVHRHHRQDAYTIYEFLSHTQWVAANLPSRVKALAQDGQSVPFHNSLRLICQYY